MAQPKRTVTEGEPDEIIKPEVAAQDMPVIVEPGSPEWQLLQEFRSGRRRVEERPRNLDYVEWGSETHMQLLGLRWAVEGDMLVYEGYTLADPGAFGLLVSEQMLKFQLMSKVSELRSGKPPIPANAPLPFVPIEKRPQFV